jgi:hypothetical protein
MRSMSGVEWPSRRPSWIAQASVYQLGANALIHPNAWNRSSSKFAHHSTGESGPPGGCAEARSPLPLLVLARRVTNQNLEH